MKLVETEPTLEGSTREFFDEFMRDKGSSFSDFKMTLEGNVRPKPLFRIPSADHQSEVFFDNLEMLSRFANFPLPSQAAFLKAIRSAMETNKVKRLTLTIPWGTNKQRKLLIRASSTDLSILDFELQPE